MNKRLFFLVFVFLKIGINCFAQLDFYGNKILEENCPIVKLDEDDNANKLLNKICEGADISNNFYMVSCPGTNNCQAIKIEGTSYVLYDQAFLNKISTYTSFRTESISQKINWEPILILAHELGHHLLQHTSNLSSLLKKYSYIDIELQADEYAGFILYKLGASIEEAKSGMSGVKNDADGVDHPGRIRRLQAITNGYNKAASKYRRSKNIQNNQQNIASANALAVVADQRAAKGDFKGAADFFNRAVRLDSTNKTSYLNLSIAYVELKKYDSALFSINQAILKGDSSSGVFSERALIRTALNNYAEALSDYNIALSLTPDASRVYFNRANLLHKMKKNKEAIDDYGIAISINPKYYKAYLMRGVVLCDQFGSSAGVNDFNKAIEIQPAYALAYLNRGKSFMKLKQWESALQDFKKYVKYEPDSSSGYYNISESYYALSQYQTAIEYCAKGLKLDPTDIGFEISAKIKIALKDIEGAKRDMEYSVAAKKDELTDESARIQKLINSSVLYLEVGYPERALPLINEAIRTSPSFDSCYFIRANIFRALKDYKSQFSDLQTAVKMKPENGYNWINLGNYKKDQGDHKGAISDFNKAINLDPTLVLGYLNRGVSKYTIKDFSGALIDFNKTIELYSLNKSTTREQFGKIYYNRAMANTALENYRLAISDYSKVIEFTPENPYGFYNRAVIYIQLMELENGCKDLRSLLALGFEKEKIEQLITSICK